MDRGYSDNKEQIVEAYLVAQTVKNLPVMRETQVYPWVRKTPGEGNSNPLQYSCLQNPINRGA